MVKSLDSHDIPKVAEQTAPTDEERMAEAQRLMKEEGYSMAEALAVVMDQEREAEAPPAKPDPRVEFLVSLAPRHAEWLERMARYEAALRRDPNMSPGRYLEILVRQEYAADPGKHGIEAESSGQRGSFNPVTGKWDA